VFSRALWHRFFNRRFLELCGTGFSTGAGGSAIVARSPPTLRAFLKKTPVEKPVPQIATDQPAAGLSAV